MNTPGPKRGIESPSAWKSPWFMTTLLPGTKIDADIPVEVGGSRLSTEISHLSQTFYMVCGCGGERGPRGLS